MATVNVYERYFKARHTAFGVPRRAALVMLVAESEAGRIRYDAAVTFFPHSDPEDFAVSYDDYHSATLYDAPGRRSRKREAALLEGLRESVEAMLAGTDAVICWDEPLRDARGG